jgi:hypothetical protein
MTISEVNEKMKINSELINNNKLDIIKSDDQ